VLVDAPGDVELVGAGVVVVSSSWGLERPELVAEAAVVGVEEERAADVRRRFGIARADEVQVADDRGALGGAVAPPELVAEARVVRREVEAGRRSPGSRTGR
jgi:hypothetical protein